jgi:RHS repeat-associated protein
MNRFFRVLCLLLLSISPVAFAQNLGTGLYAFGSFDSKGFDTINLGNLNTHFEIPIVNKQGRGMNFTYSLVYDGLVWAPSSSSGTGYWEPDPSWGFHGDLLGGAYTGYLTYAQGQLSCPASGVSHPPPGFTLSNFVYHDPYGKNHWFNYQLRSCPLTGDVVTGNGASSDGSGLSYDISDGLIRTRNGSIINAPESEGTSGVSSSITDTNGNEVTNNGNGTFTDTLGVNELTIGGSGTPTSPMTFTYPVTLQASSAPSATAAVAYRAYTVQTNFQCSGVTEYGATSIDLVDHITLADGVSTYSFTYEATPGVAGAVTGRLASVTLPTGGTISYAYSGGCSGAGIEADGTTGGLTRVTTDGTKTYTRATVNANATSTTVTDEKGNQSLYQFTMASSLSYETHRQLYQGAIGGTPLMEQLTCYNGVQPNCDGVAVTVPFTQTTTVASYNGLDPLTTNNTYNAYGMLTSSTQQNGTTALASTTNTYNSLEEVLTSTTRDGVGSVVSEIGYAYDGAPPTATSGIPQHVAEAGVRGNPTTQYVETGSGAISTTTTYYDTGTPIAVTTPSGTTQYGYDGTQTFATSTTLPTPSSGVSLATSASYDPQSGAQISATGLNPGQTMQVTQYDPLLRPVVTTLPNGDQISDAYRSPNQTGVTQPTGEGTTADTETLFDAYGRTSRVAVANGQASNPWYQTDYCYDATGLLQFKSVPYQGNGWGTPMQCSGAGTSYVYDALGRVLSSTTPDGTSHAQYQGRAVETTSIAGVQRITQYDLLGRISTVCEISSNNLMPQSGSTAACGTDIAGTGFLTTYTYNTATLTTTISQGAQARTVRTDEAGRTISTTEPERGTTTYSYAYNSTGLVVTRQRPEANQTNASVLTTTTTQYDSLGRVLSISYSNSDGTTPTPTKNFTYDTSAGWSDLTQSYLKGQLSIASVAGASTVFSYGASGSVSAMEECLPSGCGNMAYDKQLQYNYDLAGNLTSSSDGAGVTTTYRNSPANEVTSINSSLVDCANPASVVSSVQNGPHGPINYTLGNGVSSVSSYDTLGRLNTGWVCSGSTSASCSGGTQFYAFSASWQGSNLTASSDSILNQASSYGYDEFNRLHSFTVTSGAGGFNYTYDRYGNRWQQNPLQSGPSPSLSFNPATNQINTGAYTYDAAGNLTYDGFTSYTYDAEGNVTAVGSGGVAQYVYNALNQRVRTVTSAGTREFVFNAAGQRVSIWDGISHNQIQGQYYWGSKPVAFYTAGAIHFQHQDWLGTERLRTAYTGGVEGSFTSLPFGDAQNALGTDKDAYHYATLDFDAESSTDHAQFRQYSSTQGRWMSPDPYNGSYRSRNPQSFNRYSYAMNRPLSGIDPLGLDLIDPPGDGGGGGGGGDCGYDSCVTAPPDSPFPTEPDPGGCIGTCGAQPPQAPPPPTPPAQNSVDAPSNLVPKNPCAYMGRALPPSGYAMAGKQANGSLVNFSLDVAMGFPRGGYLDAQPLGTGSSLQRAAYGNYAFGVYMASAGISLSTALSGGNAYAFFSGAKYGPSNGPMDPNYQSLPAANVANITNGYNAQASGTPCHN